MLDVGLEEFANQIKRRRGRMSQADLATLAGVSKSLIERLETKKADAPKTGRYEAIDLATAVGWNPDEALALLDYPPMDDHDREYLAADAPRKRLDRIWPHLTRHQQHALVALVSAMFAEHSPISAPDPAHNHTMTRQGLRLSPGSGEVPHIPTSRADDEPSGG